MALVECPECGKEISDQAEKCPNCGYQKPHSPKIKFQKKHIAIVGGCLVAVVAILAICLVGFKERPTFDKISKNMTKEEVRKKFGKPASTENDGYTDNYNSSFVGLDGKLSVGYYGDDKRVGSLVWDYELKDEEDISDYSDQIDQIKEFFTDKYGSPEESDDGLIWEDSSGQEYELRIRKKAKRSKRVIPADITIWISPRSRLKLK